MVKLVWVNSSLSKPLCSLGSVLTTVPVLASECCVITTIRRIQPAQISFQQLLEESEKISIPILPAWQEMGAELLT